MTHQTFKVSIIIDDSVENFYIKHFVDDFQPIFHKFKVLVFQRNPCVNSPNLKVYWIDAENDKILISCEEDFRLYIEQGQGKKVFFSVINGPTRQQTQQEDEEEEIAMEAEESNERQRTDRKSRKSTRDEEKQRRASKRLSEKMRSAEEKVRTEEERRLKHPEKFERKNAERLERAKKRCEQIRQIIGSFDPANLGASSSPINVQCSASAVPSDSTAQQTVDPVLAALSPSAETIRLLSNAIAGCLQPCNLINKILNEIIGMVPIVPEVHASASAQNSSDQQQQTEVLRQNTATNTSDINTPTAVHPSNQEIEALFKEAAKELEKMNEIVNNSKSMDSSAASTSASIGSSISAITQVERFMKNLTDSTFSNATLVNMEPADYEDQTDHGVAREPSPDIEHDYKIVTPQKSMRSRESSIEVHDENSMISDDSRDWTMLDAHAHETEDDVDASFASAHGGNFLVNSSPQVELNVSSNQSAVDSKKEEKPTGTVSAQLQTPTSPFVGTTQEEVRASIQKSIETVGELSEIVKNSVAMAQESLKSVQTPQTQPILKLRPEVQFAPTPTVAEVEVPIIPVQAPTTPVTFVPNVPARPPPAIPARISPTSSANPSQLFLQNLSATTQANLMANRNSAGAKPKTPKMGPAVVVYDPNPKINASVHQMLHMGFSNEGGWLTQLLLNVDGDVPKAINFLTPQPKNKPQ